MYEQVEKPKESKSGAVDNSVGQMKKNQGIGFVDNRPEAIAQRKLQEMADISQRPKQTAQLQTMVENRFTQQQPLIQKKENNTGLPDNLKSGIENLSGYSMDDVKVHYSSDKPAQLNAHAYAQGNQIHLGAGQEKHLPHEAWHVVQQKQGRVKPTIQMKGKVIINGDAGLKREADNMGNRALQMVKAEGQIITTSPIVLQAQSTHDQPVQRIRIRLDHGIDNIMNNVRASPVPAPGPEVNHQDGFANYDVDHPAIGNNENIILEGHGTYLNDEHLEGADYDSQAYLMPEQLANVARLVPKGPGWAGQIILFGCNTGPLTMEVSRHYLALTGNSVNVVGTVADIRMEIRHPDGPDQDHHSPEYDAQENNIFPMAPIGNVSPRTQVQRWLYQGETIALDALENMNNFYSTDEGLNSLRDRIHIYPECFSQVLDIHLPNYQGLTYGGGTDGSPRQIALIRDMMIAVIPELLQFEEMLGDNDSSLDELKDKASKFLQFFDQMLTELRLLERLTVLAKASYPAGTVDWEGENVINSRAQSTQGLNGDPINQDDINPDQWGGGGQMLEQVMVQDNAEEHDDLL